MGVDARDKFETDLNRARSGEAVTLEYLYGLKSCKRVIDARQDKRYQAEDVDFLAEMDNGVVAKIETKTDGMSHTTGNLAYELTTSGNVGCFEKTKADRIFYYEKGNGNLWSISVYHLREYVHSHKLKLVKMGDASTGYLIKIKTLEELEIMHKVAEYN